MNEVVKTVTKEIAKKGTKGNLKSLPVLAKNFVKTRAPELAIGSGTGLLLLACGFGIWGTVKAVKILDNDTEERKQRIDDGEEGLTVKRTKTETLKLIWKPYVPMAITVVSGVTSIGLGLKAELGKSAAAAAALTATQEAYEKYKETVEGTVGDKKKDEINNKWASKQAGESTELAVVDQPKKSACYENIRKTGDGVSLMFFPIVGLYARTAPIEIWRAGNEINQRLGYGENTTLEEYFEELGIDDIPDICRAIIWDANNGMLDVSMTDAKLMETGEACAIVELKQKHGGPYAMDPRALMDY